MNLPQILSQTKTENSAELLLSISAELEAFKGHFDSAPIIPGVEQLRWVLIFSQQIFGLEQEPEVIRVDALKFQNVIQPGYQVSLELQQKEGRIDFVYSSSGLRHSSGRVYTK
jgi:3-hydroxymyristoyl/3-hydroxydecanoyl-(acyl carrier protein) dehydratase